MFHAGIHLDVGHLDFTEGMRLFDESHADLRDTVLQVPPFMDPAEWIFNNIELEKGESTRPGKMRLTGYQLPVARKFLEEGVSEITILKGARVGWSRFMSGMVAYGLAYLGISVTIAQPTDDDAQSFYNEVIKPLFDRVKALRDLKRTPARGDVQDRWNEHYLTNGAVLRIVSAASDDSFRRYGSKWNFGDEYSAKGWAATKGSQGEKADLFAERGGEWLDSILALGSTPLGVDDCRTYKRWLVSDQSMPHVVCPHCSTQQEMVWGDKDPDKPGFKWTKDENGFVDVCWYRCVNGCRIYESSKQDLVDSIEFIARRVPDKPGHFGPQWPQWFSFAGKAAWKLLAQRFLNAQGDPEKLKTWTNNVKGWPYDDFTTSAMDGTALLEWQVPYPAEVPDDVVVIVAGGDTQTNKEGSDLEQIASREIQVVGFNRFGQLRHIAYYVVEGAPGDPRADAEVTAILDKTYRKRDGSEWPITASAFDLGGHFADETRAFCGRFPTRRNVWAVKGRNNAKGTRSALVFPTRASRSHKSGAKFYTIDSQLARDALFRLLQLKGEHAPMFPASLPPDFFSRLMCEERKKLPTGWYWQPKKGGRAEEEWMTLTYALAALRGLQHGRKSQWGDLNLAADRLGVPAVAHDPETGELDYSGPCRSVGAAGLAAAPGDPGPSGSPAPAAPAAPTVPDPQPSGRVKLKVLDGPPVQKLRVGKVVRSSRWTR